MPLPSGVMHTDMEHWEQQSYEAARQRDREALRNFTRRAAPVGIVATVVGLLMARRQGR